MCMAGIGGILGAVVSAAGAMMSAQMQAAQYEYQAKLHERQAKVERLAGAHEADMKIRQGKRVQGAIRSTHLASGISLSGSAIDAAVSSGIEEDLDVAAVRFNSTNAAAKEKGMANVNRFNAKSARIGGAINAITPIISAFGRMNTGNFQPFSFSNMFNQ